MSDDKMCPMLSMGNPIGRECVKEDCAWWITEEPSECSMKIIAATGLVNTNLLSGLIEENYACSMIDANVEEGQE